MTTVGADPAELDRLAAGGPGQAFGLVNAAAWLERTGTRYQDRSPSSHVDVRGAVARLRALADRVVDLDEWVRDVAAALRTADRGGLDLRLLSLGHGHPAVRTGAPPSRTDAWCWSSADLAALAAVPRLPPTWRDPVHRMRVRRWLAKLDERVAAVPADDHGWFARLVDDALVDRLSPAADLHRTREEQVTRLRAEAAGAKRLLFHPDLTVLSFSDGARPTIRVAFGDPTTATHLAVLLPGTGTGLHAVRTGLEDAAALHRHATLAAPDGRTLATVLDLHAAPADLGRAADPRPSRAAGAATAAFLADLGAARPDGPPRTTLVGHSYGALVAARASDDHAVDDLVLLGAPGTGVEHRDDLGGATRVWAARASGDPIGIVADLDELVGLLPERWRPSTGPLTDPLVAHGPDPADPDFGARRLATAATGAGFSTIAARGHLDYLTPGTTSLDNVARVVTGVRQPGPVRRARPPRRGRRGSAAGG